MNAESYKLPNLKIYNMDKPLVSVCVLSYNSGETILDTLESIYNQDYKNIELIISDDGSKDETINIATEWLKNHKDRFINTYLLSVYKNTGVPANCNRAIAVCNGKWIKLIAADDCLLTECLTSNVDFVSNNQDIHIMYTRYYDFIIVDGKKKLSQNRISESFYKEFDTNAKKQLKLYIERGYNITPSLFINKYVFNVVGGFIEKYNLFEDSPFIAKVLNSNIKIYYSPQYTVLYRIDNSSITRDASKRTFYNENFTNCLLEFRKDMIYPLYRWYELHYWLKEYSFRISYFFSTRILKNKSTPLNRKLLFAFNICNPYNFFSAVIRRGKNLLK